jgi:hypothetical protein
MGYKTLWPAHISHSIGLRSHRLTIRRSLSCAVRISIMPYNGPGISGLEGRRRVRWAMKG